MVCWMSERGSLKPGRRYTLKHTTHAVRAMVKDLQYQLDINTLHRNEGATELGLNEIGRITLRTTQPLYCDDYGRNRETGGFILIDEATNQTVAAGMLEVDKT